ncbi:MAG: universal stress protein, partial [Gammaproteobacteria bacterium]|nr:universal stress protein [Gammaproteobacteria bacterium]
PLHVISAYDPYYHYVAFNRIAGVLSEEAGKVFRFQEQEQLHEDIIDAGLAKIYQGHLEVAQTLADEADITIVTKLLDGKPYEVIQQYVDEVQAGLLVLGKTGIHADEDLDIGGQAENLLRNVNCAVLLSHRGFTPDTETIAETTTSWTHQAEERMEVIPQFVRSMARLGILRYAQEQGHTVITESIVAEATKDLCPASIRTRREAGPTTDDMEWSDSAKALLATLENKTQMEAVLLKAEKKARQEGASMVDENHVSGFIKGSQTESGCPFNHASGDTADTDRAIEWNDEALARLERVPEGFMRDMTRKRMEDYAHQHDCDVITPDLMGNKYDDWSKGSEVQEQTLVWEPAAQDRLNRIPPFVQGMVMKEVESHAAGLGTDTVTTEIMETASKNWEGTMTFHSTPGDD